MVGVEAHTLSIAVCTSVAVRCAERISAPTDIQPAILLYLVWTEPAIGWCLLSSGSPLASAGSDIIIRAAGNQLDSIGTHDCNFPANAVQTDAKANSAD